jgi:protein-tyrosine phosphatase
MVAQLRQIALEGAHNVRDLGGYATLAGAQTRWRSVLRGDALHRLTAADVERLLALGLVAVIDLRNNREVVAEANPFAAHSSVRYHNISLFSALSPVEMMVLAQADFDMGDRYCQALDMCQEAIAEVLTAVAEAPEGLLLFHCSAGKDRTGVIAALLLANAGVDHETIAEDYALTGSASGPLISILREKALARGLASGLVDVIVASDPQTMDRALAHLDDCYGGADGYLRQIGLGLTDIDSLKRRLCD